jgi:hypothetical protein
VSPENSAIHERGEFWSTPHDGLGTDDGGAALEIENEFRRRMQGLRGLTRRERAAAYRAAKKWYREALVALREKQSRDRQAAWSVRRARARRFAPIGPSP